MGPLFFGGGHPRGNEEGERERLEGGEDGGRMGARSRPRNNGGGRRERRERG